MSSSAGNPIFQEVMRRYRKHDEELRALFPALAAARVAFFRSKSDSDLEVMETLEGRVQAMNADLEQLAVELRGASGLSEAELATLDSISDGKPNPDNREMRVRRADLTVDRVESTADIDSLLPVALERLEAIVPAAFLEGQADVPHGMEPIIEGREPLSLIKGIRPEGEASDLHRLRQMIRVGRDYLAARPTYDHFSGALLVPQLAQLGAQLPALEQVGGDWRARIRRLWEEPSDKVDSTVFELLVAAAFVRQGRSVEFINENRGERTPDLRCMEPYPMQVECKRKRTLSQYDLKEERAMRVVFAALHDRAKRLGVHGRFTLLLTEEISTVDPDELATTMLRQRLAARPERPLQYPWGTVAFSPMPQVVELPFRTKLFSPRMLEAFGWHTDLPKWDGLICTVENEGEAVVDRFSNPFALVWTNSHQNAVKSRAWSPLDLIGEAMGQFTPGEFGMIYVAYQEGAREEIADRRVQGFLDRMPEWHHHSSIRVPLALLVRLYPRVLEHGQPDLIESSVRFSSSVYGDPSMFQYFPQRVFTPQ